MENLQGGMLSLEHRYRVDERADRHALLTRYRAHQLPFEAPVWVAVYDVLAEAGAGRALFDRIKEAAHRAHEVQGEAVLEVLDYGEIERGIPFVVEQRVEGPSLAEHLEERGTLAPKAAARLVDRCARALTAAHDLDVAHGRLDPDWIFLPEGKEDEAVVGHFHVGVALGELRRLDGVVLESELVRPYPPETFELDTLPPPGAEEDAHSPADEFTVAGDVYALGVVAYESLVGFHPYFDEESSDAEEGMVRLREGDARPLEEFGVEPEVSDVVARAIAHDPDARWESARAFADAFGEATGEIASDTVPPSARQAEEGESSDSVPGIERGRAEPVSEREGTDEAEPAGPASTLVSMAVLLLVGTNVGWLLYALQPGGASGGEEASSAPSAQSQTLRVQSRPSGATVYPADGEDPLGMTPLTVEPKLLEEGPVELRLVGDEGRLRGQVTLQSSGDRRDVTVHLARSESEARPDGGTGETGE